jgi:hypothetical protein
MKQEKKVETLINFLKSEKAYDAYLEAIKIQYYGLELKKVLARRSAHGFISNTIIYANTKEGWDYWRGLSKKWSFYFNERYMESLRRSS